MSTLLRERRDAGVEILRLNRPDVRNALDTATLDELNDALSELRADDALRAIVFSTTDTRAFSAGADVSESLNDGDAMGRMEGFSRLYATIDELEVPTICVCVGNCVGAGAEIAAGCDLRVAGENLEMSWPGGRLGVPVGPARLVPLVGLSRAKELIFTGRTIGAAEAEALGLLAGRGATEAAEGIALELAGGLAALAQDNIPRLKDLFREFEHTAERIDRENDGLENWQRHGAGLPRDQA